MATDPIAIDRSALVGASRSDLIALAKNIAKAKETATKVGPQTDDELHAFIVEKWGINVPRVAVTPGFDAPFDYVADIYFERIESALIVGGRETAKTMNVALINALNAIFKPGYWAISAGAIDEQSRNAYKALMEILRNWGSELVKGASLQSKTEFKNRSLVEVKGGCFPEQAKIITDCGDMRIDQIVNQQLSVNVKSYNFKNERWEWKPVTNWFVQEKTDEWESLLFEYGRQGQAHLTVTPGHEILRPNGEKTPMEEIVEGDEICVPGEQLSGEQYQLAIGSLLGDASIQSTGIWTVSHCYAQKDFLDWKHDALREMVSCRDERASRSTERIRTSAKRVFHELRHDWYPDGKKLVPEYVWDELDELGLAVWLMDDGSFLRSPNSRCYGMWSISALSFNAQERDGASRFFDRIGIEGEWCCYNRQKDQWYWRATTESSVALSALVADYIDVSERQSKGWKRWIASPISEHSYETMMTARVKKRWKSKRRPSKRYDITVADNHNYCAASGILVGNTRSQLNGPHSNSLHRDEIELFDRAAFDEGDNITKSGVTTDGREIKAVDILTTSRKFAKGLLQELLDECDKAIKAGRKPPHRVYKVGVAETVKRVPNCRGLEENKGKPDCDLCDCHEMFKGTWDDGTDRTLEQVCGGRFGRSDGWRPLDPDIKKKFLTNSRFMWEAQQECMRPAGEGLILASFKEAVHVISSYDPKPEYGKIYQSTDFGGGNPHAANWYQHITVPVTVKDFYGDDKVLPAGSLVCFAEVYVTEIGNMELAALIVAMEAKYKAIHGFDWEIEERYADVANRAARIDFRNYDPPLRTTWRVTREIEEHITKCQGIVNDKSFYVLKGGEDGSGCPMFIEEAEAWQRDPATGKQIDTFNHCCPAGTLVATPDGDIPIELVEAGDVVVTAQGESVVVAAGVTQLNADVYEIVFDDGSTLRATDNHPCWVDGKGWVSVSDIRYADRLWKLLRSPLSEERQSSSSSEEFGFGDTQMRKTTRRVSTTGRGSKKRISESNHSIVKFGKQLMERFLLAVRSTIETSILSTTRSTISNVSPQKNIDLLMQDSHAAIDGESILTKYGHKISPRTSSTQKSEREHASAIRSSSTPSKRIRLFESASNAAESSQIRRFTEEQSSVATLANQRIAALQGLTTNKEHAQYADSSSESIGTQRNDHVLVSVVSISLVSNEDVYDLTIDGAHEFYADGIRVHNSMSNFRYAVANIDRKLQIERRKGIGGGVAQSVAAEQPGDTNLVPASDLPNTGPVSTNYNDDQQPFDIPLHRHGASETMDRMW